MMYAVMYEPVSSSTSKLKSVGTTAKLGLQLGPKFSCLLRILVFASSSLSSFLRTSSTYRYDGRIHNAHILSFP